MSSQPVELKGRIHELGGRCKTAALDAKTKMAAASVPMKPAYFSKCVAMYMLFIVYRSYRGFFIIIPAVFKEVQAKLTAGMVEAENELNADVDPQTGKLRPRSRAVISVGASIVTLIYSIKTVASGVFFFFKSLGQAMAGTRKEVPADDAAETPKVASG